MIFATVSSASFSVIADRALKPEVAKTLSDIADQLMEKKEPKEVLEIMLGGSAGKFFQSLQVPDGTLLYFKLQFRIPDQGWQILLSKFGYAETQAILA